MVDPKGHQAASPWEMPRAAWKDIASRTYKRTWDDNVGLVAAGVAFYSFFALLSLLGLIVLVYGFVADPVTVIDHIRSLTGVLPTDVAFIIGDQLMNAVKASEKTKGLGILLAFLVATYGGTNGAASVITALNIAYEEEEKRSTIRVNLMALSITAGAVLMAVVALLAITATGYLRELLPHLPAVLIILGKIVSYVLLFLGAAAAAATLYRYAPDRRKAKWQWITPGSLFAALAWLALTLGFGIYVANFGNYNKTYGSLATVVILVTWMYFSAYVFLLGAELNSELEHQTAVDTTEGTSKPLGQRGAWSADHVAQGSEPQKPSGEGVSPPSSSDQDHHPAHALDIPESRTSVGRNYVTSRAANRAVRLAGLPKVGALSAALSTVGLSMIRRRGREYAGAALLATAVGLSLLKRQD